MKKILIVSGVLVLVLAGFLIMRDRASSQTVSGVVIGSATDLVGTRIGTSTTGVYFNKFTNGSTSYPFYIGGDTELVTLTLRAITASTTEQGGGRAYMSILASNDPQCNVATTSSDVGNQILKSQINWFDASPNFRNIVGLAAAAPVGTTTIDWLLSAGTGREVILNGLNSQCLSLVVNASSTSLWIQYRTKGNQ